MAKPRFMPMQALALVAGGMTVREVAADLGCHRDTVYSLLTMARAVEAYSQSHRDITPENVGVFAECVHQENPKLPGDPFVCVECHQSGLDWKPGMKALALPRDKKKYKPDPKLKGGTS